MTEYQKGKERARNRAMDFQNSFVEGKTWYMSEIAEETAVLERLGRRYGLLTEFRENGIL